MVLFFAHENLKVYPLNKPKRLRKHVLYSNISKFWDDDMTYIHLLNSNNVFLVWEKAMTPYFHLNNKVLLKMLRLFNIRMAAA